MVIGLNPLFILSEKRDSNPRPRPWQGRALPTELFSQSIFIPFSEPDLGIRQPTDYQLSYSRILFYFQLATSTLASVSRRTTKRAILAYKKPAFKAMQIYCLFFVITKYKKKIARFQPWFF